MFGLAAILELGAKFGSAALEFATSRVGLPICVAAAIVLFYEGVPPLIDGRVDHAYTQGKLDEEAAARARAVALIEKRMKDDAEIKKMPSADICRELGGEWVQPDGPCN